MKLTSKDLAATVLAAAAVAVFLPVTRSWDWPLLGSYRMGIVALLIIGQGSCVLGGSADAISSLVDRKAHAVGAADMVAIALGGLALVLAVIGLIVGTRAPFVALVADILVLWVVSTLRHALGAPAHPVGPVRVA